MSTATYELSDNDLYIIRCALTDMWRERVGDHKGALRVKHGLEVQMATMTDSREYHEYDKGFRDGQRGLVPNVPAGSSDAREAYWDGWCAGQRERELLEEE